MKVYLASGWFSEDQLKLCKSLEETLDVLGYDTFKPRVKSKITSVNPTMEERKETFKGNVTNIDNADMVLANVTYVDKGVLFEVGYAYAKGKIIIFYNEDNSKPFNLMLAQASDYAPASNIKELTERLLDVNSGVTSDYQGTIE